MEQSSVRVQRAWGRIHSDGFPQPYQTLGASLALDGALSILTVREVRSHRTDRSEDARNRAVASFEARIANLANTRQLLRRMIETFGHNGVWDQLDATIKEIDPGDIIDMLREDYMLHPFPVVIKSDEYNANYVRDHGVRKFYEMTDEYVEKVEQVTHDSFESFQREVAGEPIDPYWLIRMDLVGVEVPTHCDVCRIVISTLTRMNEIELGDSFRVRHAKAASQVLDGLAEGIPALALSLGELRTIR